MIVYCDADDCKWNEDGKCKRPVQPAGHTALYIRQNRRELRGLSPADVAPVVHSRWIKTADGAECEKCGREAVYQIIDDHWQYEPFCPHCGAIMDGHR